MGKVLLVAAGQLPEGDPPWMWHLSIPRCRWRKGRLTQVSLALPLCLPQKRPALGLWQRQHRRRQGRWAYAPYGACLRIAPSSG